MSREPMARSKLIRQAWVTTALDPVSHKREWVVVSKRILRSAPSLNEALAGPWTLGSRVVTQTAALEQTLRA